jgi:hypothetical protein
MFDIGLSPGKKWGENSSMTSFLLSNGVKAFNKGKVVISSELIPAKNTVD